MTDREQHDRFVSGYDLETLVAARASLANETTEESGPENEWQSERLAALDRAIARHHMKPQDTAS